MTLDELREMRDAARQAWLSAVKAQSLSFGGVNNRSITHQDIKKLWDGFKELDEEYEKATGKVKRKPYSLVRFGRI